MPTLGPFFKWLRPNHWKHFVIGPKSLGNSRYEDPEPFERVWPRPTKTPSDDALLVATPPAEAGGKTRSFSYSLRAHQERGQTPRDLERAWMMADVGGKGKGELKSEIELKEMEREGGSQSS